MLCFWTKARKQRGGGGAGQQSWVQPLGSQALGTSGIKKRNTPLLILRTVAGLLHDSGGKRAWKTLKDHNNKIPKSSLPHQEQMSWTCSPQGQDTNGHVTTAITAIPQGVSYQPRGSKSSPTILNKWPFCPSHALCVAEDPISKVQRENSPIILPVIKEEGDT